MCRAHALLPGVERAESERRGSTLGSDELVLLPGASHFISVDFSFLVYKMTELDWLACLQSRVLLSDY